MGWWEWLNGKKTAIGAFLDLLYSAVSALIIWLPQLGEALNQLGPFGDWVAGTVLVLGKVLMAIGLIHKFLKSFFGAAAEQGLGRSGR